MSRKLIKLQYNSPVVLTFALLSLAVLWLDGLTGGKSTHALFSVYRSSFADLGTYPRFWLHGLGHGSYSPYMCNMTMLRVVGPPLEEKYGSRPLFWAIFLTAFVSGMVHWLFFPGTALLRMDADTVSVGHEALLQEFEERQIPILLGTQMVAIPITLILVLVLYIGGEIVDGVMLKDNISQLSHIVGGICGAFLGISMRR